MASAAPVIRTLFVEPDGKAIKFYLRPCPLKTKLRPLIEERGGILTSKAWDNAAFHLIEPNVQASSSSENNIRVDYVYDCIKNNLVLPVEKYRITKRLSLDDPTSDLSVAGSVEDYNVVTTVKNTRSRREYCQKDDLKILEYIVKQRAIQDVKGNAMWKEMGMAIRDRTWQSLKERFRKHIKVHLDYYPLTLKEHKYLKKGCDLWTKKDELKYKEKIGKALASSLASPPSLNSRQTSQTNSKAPTSDNIEQIVQEFDRNSNMNARQLPSNCPSNKEAVLTPCTYSTIPESEDTSSNIREQEDNIERLSNTDTPRRSNLLETRDRDNLPGSRKSSPTKKPKETRSDIHTSEDREIIIEEIKRGARTGTMNSPCRSKTFGIEEITEGPQACSPAKEKRQKQTIPPISPSQSKLGNKSRQSRQCFQTGREADEGDIEEHANFSPSNSSPGIYLSRLRTKDTVGNLCTASPGKKTANIEVPTTSNIRQIPEAIQSENGLKIRIYSDTDSDDTVPYISPQKKTLKKKRIISSSSDEANIEVVPLTTENRLMDASFETCITNSSAYDSFDENILHQAQKNKQVLMYERLQQPRHCTKISSPKVSENGFQEQSLTALPFLDTLPDSNSCSSFQESQDIAALRPKQVLSTPLSPKVSQILHTSCKTYSARKRLNLSDNEPSSHNKIQRHAANLENQPRKTSNTYLPPLTERNRNTSDIEMDSQDISHNRIRISKGIQDMKTHFQKWSQQLTCKSKIMVVNESDIVVSKKEFEKVQEILKAMEEDDRRATLEAQVFDILRHKPPSTVTSQDNDVMRAILEQKFSR